MNYFGMFFSFMLPGLALGAMAAAVIGGEKKKNAQTRQKAPRQNADGRRGKLFVYDLAQDGGERAA